MKRMLSIAFIALSFFCTLSCTKETATAPVSASVINEAKKTPGVVGRQQQIIIATGDYTYPTSQALLWLPKCYDSNKNRYPLIIALDGVGEQGTDINLLFHTGTIAKHISDGWNATA